MTLYYQDRSRGVNIVLHHIAKQPHSSFGIQPQQLWRAGNRVVVEIEDNGSQSTLDRIAKAAKDHPKIAAVTRGGLVLFGAKEDMLDFLVPKQPDGVNDSDWRKAGLLDPDRRGEFESLYQDIEQDIEKAINTHSKGVA